MADNYEPLFPVGATPPPAPPPPSAPPAAAASSMQQPSAYSNSNIGRATEFGGGQSAYVTAIRPPTDVAAPAAEPRPARRSRGQLVCAGVAAGVFALCLLLAVGALLAALLGWHR
ncbi:hypothetical protein M3Y99_01057200 [Aphelenchoides fujianensis]|nr:hypothetical protein M3Y99_01057200 [Aphelenchoides fujianensis]